MVFIIYEKIVNFSNKKFLEARCEDNIKISNIKLNSLYKYVENDKTKSHLDKIEDKLIKSGNPLNLTPLKYYIIKFGFTFLVALLSVFKWNLFFVAIFVVIAYFSLDVIHWYSNEDDMKNIRKDLPDLCDILDVQTSANVSLGIALTEIYDIPRSKRLKKDLVELAAEINLSKNPEKALDNFTNKYDLIEMDSFIQAIKQSLITGKSKEILNNLSESLKENNIFRVQEETRSMDIKVGLIISLIFSGMALLIVLSFANQLNDSLHSIFG